MSKLRIETLRIREFRGINDLTIEFSGLTTMVGENATGKSTIGLAIQKNLLQAATNENQIKAEDYPYGVSGSTEIRLGLILSIEELESLIFRHFLPAVNNERYGVIRTWLEGHGNRLEIVIRQSTTEVQWGSLRFTENLVAGEEPAEGNQGPWVNFARQGSVVDFRSQAALQLAVAKRSYDIGSNISNLAGASFRDRFKYFEEFRIPSVGKGRSDAVESMGGSETASVLLNLKDHTNKVQRERYEEIKESFHRFFPRFRIEAVEQTPASGVPEIQFMESGRPNPLALIQVSAGIHEVLNLLTNLIGRQGLTLFIEHPESHLHPHSMRALQSLLFRERDQNQIILVTHSPQFVDPRATEGLRRIWWTPGTGTKVAAPTPSMTEAESGQIATALKHLGDREVVFARSVVLVEDESQREFLTGVARRLSHDIDENSVSIIDVKDENGYGKYETLLNVFGIPFVALKDNGWGDDVRYPPDRYYSLGMEIEAFLDAQGLAEERQAAADEVGHNKRRIAAHLGETLDKDAVPKIFNTILSKAIEIGRSLEAGPTEPSPVAR